ncbi:MAG: hypothetical protein ACYTGB_19240, partial [Planctomycetota bacterium]
MANPKKKSTRKVSARKKKTSTRKSTKKSTRTSRKGSKRRPRMQSEARRMSFQVAEKSAEFFDRLRAHY